jgi:N utilization substance protein B
MKDSNAQDGNVVMQERIFPRTVARFAAIQAVFMIKQNEGATLEHFKKHFMSSQGAYDLFSDEQLHALDWDYFEDITAGVLENQQSLEALLQNALLGRRDVDTLESVTRIILLSGIWELLAKPTTPPKVVINEYVSIAKSLLPQKGYIFINGILDAMWKQQQVSVQQAAAQEAKKKTPQGVCEKSPLQNVEDVLCEGAWTTLSHG